MCVCVCVTYVPAGAIQAGKCYIVLPGVSPVNAVIDEVQCETVGPCDLILHNHRPVSSVHSNPSDVGAVTPVGPV